MLSNRKEQLKQVFEDTQQFYTENPILASQKIQTFHYPRKVEHMPQ